jgi:hypothetical protein
LSRTSAFCWLAFLTLGLGASSCRQIIGIEDAQLDTSSPINQGGGGNAGAAPIDNMSGAGATQAEAGRTGNGGSGAAVGGSDSAGTAGSLAEGGAGGEPSQEPTLCDDYCDAVLENCTESFAVYTSRDACLAVCAGLPPGAPGDRDVNTVQCRLRAARLAKDELPHYCPISGPGGNGSCGSNCESMCGLREQVCAEYKTSELPTCLTECAKLDDLQTYSTYIEPGQGQGQTAGPHVQCRLYHLSAAAIDDPEQHCMHADGIGPCSTD